tara:strand:- start:421 stop:690 length:270 start_codon:yes stop_codon:yes gene_type:complete
MRIQYPKLVARPVLIIKKQSNMKKFQIISISLISVFVMGCAYRLLFLIMPVVTNIQEALIVALFVGFITFCALVLCYLLKSLIIETFKK